MTICGIKLTHDGGIALLKDEQLLFSIEVEKLDNNKRYSAVHDLGIIEDILRSAGYNVADIDHVVVDGWHGTGEQWKGRSLISIKNKEAALVYEVAPYNEEKLTDDLLQPFHFGQSLQIGNNSVPYTSYMHVTGHVLGAYASSPFAKNKESSYILCWDGGLYPRLYYYNAEKDKFHNLGHLFLFLGTVYSIFGQYFGPYKKTEEELYRDSLKKEIEHYFGGYSTAGKIMSYLALGKRNDEIVAMLRKMHQELITISNTFEHDLARAVKKWASAAGHADADVLMALHIYLESLLLGHLGRQLEKHPDYTPNICLSGGCALNIKWNSAIRRSGLFREVWVPPFPNDAGSAIGTAVAHMYATSEQRYLEWSVFSGPPVKTGLSTNGWEQRACSIQELAGILYRTGEPVLFLNGRAELGPRALGNRSILAPATDPNMKQLLNEVKCRENFRPVAPICLEHRAQEIFDPGKPDPYMLFDHHVRPEWLSKVPAICHLDGSSRVETVNEAFNPPVFRLLQEYEKLSGIPLLCNTSANYNGSGFFPDIDSAARWGKLNFIWCDNIIYIKKHPAGWNTTLASAHLIKML